MKIRRPRMDIENKILIPFVCISLATVICFCAILYFTEYRVKVAAERENASTLIGYIQADLELEDYRQDPKKLSTAITTREIACLSMMSRENFCWESLAWMLRTWRYWPRPPIPSWAGRYHTAWITVPCRSGSLRNRNI